MKIRTVALCLIRRDDQILVEEIVDEVLKKRLYRPIGGTVEYGENSKQTVIREVMEEIGAEIEEPKLSFVIENIFEYLEETGHEIDFIYEAVLRDKNLYNQEHISGMEGESKYKAVWKPITGFLNNRDEKLVPDGLLELLLNQDKESISNIKHRSTT
ncbi:NUDIX hydrolase [Paenibacillus tyrfis]|uniref:NUDIX hydrolase n=1 Tax=Paenibacillus tyrfis TaxID=1501230 RepID=UPI000568E846|nr:NUDIX domain-containing protein [Paenibacillus tyrfis]